MLLTLPRWRFALLLLWLPRLLEGVLGQGSTGNILLDTTATPSAHTLTATAATPSTLERMLTPSRPPSPEPSSAFLPPGSSILATVYISPSPDAANGGSGDGGLRLGLGLGVGIGLPLVILLGVGCFLLWRLLGKTCPMDFLKVVATAESEKQKQQQQHRWDSDDDYYAAAAYPKELSSAETVTTGPPEILSTEVYEAGGCRGRCGLLSWAFEGCMVYGWKGVLLLIRLE
ncbi:hypothetical protein PG997_011424 [Apiospora hydei]|uniref:Uncharacterized protein n=1 Tax=Apiospora hydei TaxID=1337664 RepID=A0ABR1VJ05_9PEZI